MNHDHQRIFTRAANGVSSMVSNRLPSSAIAILFLRPTSFNAGARLFHVCMGGWQDVLLLLLMQQVWFHASTSGAAVGLVGEEMNDKRLLFQTNLCRWINTPFTVLIIETPKDSAVKHIWEEMPTGKWSASLIMDGFSSLSRDDGTQ